MDEQTWITVIALAILTIVIWVAILLIINAQQPISRAVKGIRPWDGRCPSCDVAEDEECLPTCQLVDTRVNRF